MTSLILRTGTGLMLPVLLLFSLFLLWRGHHEPGGGFSGGLVAASAFVLYSIARDAATARQLLRFDPHVLIGGGLLLAIATAALPLTRGLPLLTSQWFTVGVRGLGEIELGTPLLFDIGVYLVVVGVTLTILLTLEDE